jgi:protein-histidine pros-kinase
MDIFGYTPEELRGKPLDILIPDRCCGAHSNHLRAFFGGPKSRMMGSGLALWGCRKDASEFPPRSASARWPFPSGMPQSPP